MMDVMAASAGGNPHLNHADFSQDPQELQTAKVGYLMMPSKVDHQDPKPDTADGVPEPSELPQSLAASVEEDMTGDLDSTGDSDRLVIADEASDSESERQLEPPSATASQNNHAETSVKPSQEPPRSCWGLPEATSATKPVDNKSAEETDTYSSNLRKVPGSIKEAQVALIPVNTEAAPRDSQEPQPVRADDNPTTAVVPVSECTSELKVEKTEADESAHPEVETQVTSGEPENKAFVESADFDSQSNASTDSGRDQSVLQTTSDQATEKKRRRRKPIKVSKHEPLSEENFKEKFDNNYNTLEVVPEVKPVSRLMNSFVAKAMKLWYDEELPKTLTSPSKDMSKLTPESKNQLAKDKQAQEKKTSAGLNDVRDAVRGGETVGMKSEHADRAYRSGVAPDDQYYSTPSPATPESRAPSGGQREYWTPARRCTSPGTMTGRDQALTPDGAPVGTPLVAKAMQSLSSPSPAVSPSLASDQESPSSGPKRYFCSLCNKSFTFRTNLTRHQRAFHGRPCRRRTHDAGGKEDAELPRTHSVSSEDADHLSDRRDFTEDKLVVLPKTEPHVESANYGRFSPSVVSDAKAGRFSPSMPSPSVSSSEPLSLTRTPLAPYTPPPPPASSQNYIVITPKEAVSCSLCLTTFESQSELSRHEPTCRGIDRSKLHSDAFGAIDLTKPKVCKVEPAESAEPESHATYKPKFHYNMADMISTNATLPLEPPLTAPFLAHPAALHSMPLLPHHLTTSGLLPPQLAAGIAMPFSGNSGPGKRRYKCTLCTKKYSSFTSLAKHVGLVHKINLMGLQQQHQPQNDNMAALVAMANAEMKMLVEQEQSGALNLSGEGMAHFPCKICGQTFTIAANLRAHYHNVHLGVKDTGGRDSMSPDLARVGSKSTEWVCDICGQNFASKRNLNRHLSHVHKVDRKRDAQLQNTDGRSTPVDTKPLLPGVTSGVPSVTSAVNLCTPKDEVPTSGVHHLQDVIDRVVSSDISLKQEEKPTPVPIVPAPAREHPVKLPPKKAIMEEYQKEAEMKLRLEREQQQQRLLEEQRASPARSEDSGVLNLSQSKPPVTSEASKKSREADQEDTKPAVIDLSAPQGLTKEIPPMNLSTDEKNKLLMEGSERREYYPNPFSAILNLSQTYLRKLLNETPMPTPPPHHPDYYSTATIKDKENSIENDRYCRNMSYNKVNMQSGRDYSPDTTSRLRDMLSSKGLGGMHGNGYHSDDSRCSSRNNSLPPSGRSTPVETGGHYDRRPLVMASENQSENTSLSDISPLRMNTANMMALKQKLMDQNAIITPEWKPKNIKKRKNSDYSVEDLVSKEKLVAEGNEPAHKKARETSSLLATSGENETGKLPKVDSIKTGEFPAIAIGKRHICGLCGASFTFQTNLTRHQRKLHGKPFVRKSSVNQTKGEGPQSLDESLPLSMVPKASPTPLTLINQE